MCFKLPITCIRSYVTEILIRHGMIVSSHRIILRDTSNGIPNFWMSQTSKVIYQLLFSTPDSMPP